MSVDSVWSNSYINHVGNMLVLRDGSEISAVMVLVVDICSKFDKHANRHLLKEAEMGCFEASDHKSVSTNWWFDESLGC